MMLGVLLQALHPTAKCQTKYPYIWLGRLSLKSSTRHERCNIHFQIWNIAKSPARQAGHSVFTYSLHV